VETAFVESSCDRFTFDQELDFEAWQQDFVEHPDSQFGLADGETPHLGPGTPTRGTAGRVETLIILPLRNRPELHAAP
jgi:hypothetical protein